MKFNQKLFVIFIFCFGIGARLLVGLHTLDWNDDVARDALIAAIAKPLDIITSTGHWNSGFNFNYPSYYYVGRSLLSLFFPTYTYLLVFHFSLHAISGFFVYKIIQLLSPKQSQLSLFAIIAYYISPVFISASTLIWSAYTTLPFIIAALYLFLDGTLVRKKYAILKVILGYMGAIFCSTIFGGNLLVVISMLLISLMLQPRKAVWFLPASVITYFVLYIPTIGQIGLTQFVLNHIQFGTHTFAHFYERLALLSTNGIFYSQTIFVNIMTVIVISLLSIFSARNSSQRKVILVFVLTLLITLTFVIKNQSLYHGISVYPFIFILFGVSLNQLHARKSVLFFLIVLLGINLFPVNKIHKYLRRSIQSPLNFVTDPFVYNLRDGELIVLANTYDSITKINFYQSFTLWYASHLTHKSRFVYLDTTEADPLSLGGISYGKIPQVIKLVCIIKNPALYGSLGTISQQHCDLAAHFLLSNVGMSIDTQSFGDYVEIKIEVDGEKYLVLKQQQRYLLDESIDY